MSRRSGFVLLAVLRQSSLHIAGEPRSKITRTRREAVWTLSKTDGTYFSPTIELRVSASPRRPDMPHYSLRCDSVTDRKDKSLARMDVNDDHGQHIRNQIHIHEAINGEGDDAFVADYHPNPAPLSERVLDKGYYQEFLRYFCNRYGIDHSGVNWDIGRWWSR